MGIRKWFILAIGFLMIWGTCETPVMGQDESGRDQDNTEQKFIETNPPEQIRVKLGTFRKSTKGEVLAKLAILQDEAKLEREREEAELRKTKEGFRKGIKERDSDLPPEYDFTNRAFRQKIIDQGYHFGIVMTGWSESSLGKMGRTNQEKQKREFAKGYTLMLDTEENMRAPSGKRAQGRMIYLSINEISPEYRYYLYKSYYPEATLAQWKEFDQRVLTIFNFQAPTRKRGDAYDMSYLNQGVNAGVQCKLSKTLNHLRLESEVKTQFVGFTGHFTGVLMQQWAQEMELPYLLNPPEKANYIAKSMGRKCYRDAGVLHPIGTYDPVFSIEGVIDEIYKILSHKAVNTKKIVMKLEESAAGHGNRILTFHGFDKLKGEEENKTVIRHFFTQDMAKDDRDPTKKYPADFVKRIEKDGAIVEQFIIGENFNSPATIYMIDGQGEVHFMYSYQQLLGGEHSEIFKGSQGPVSTYKCSDSDVDNLSHIIGRYLSQNGVRGVVGTDFVMVDDVCTDEEREAHFSQYGEKKVKVYAIENNVRNTGTSYPLMTVRNFLGYKFEGKFMKSYDDVAIPELNYGSLRSEIFKKLFPALVRHPHNLNRKTGEGCLVHLETARLGKLGVVCVADSMERVKSLFEAYTYFIRTFVERMPSVQQLTRFNALRRNPSTVKGRDFSCEDFVKDERERILTYKNDRARSLSILHTGTIDESVSTWNTERSFSVGHVQGDEMARSVRRRSKSERVLDVLFYFHPNFPDRNDLK